MEGRGGEGLYGSFSSHHHFNRQFRPHFHFPYGDPTNLRLQEQRVSGKRPRQVGESITLSHIPSRSSWDMCWFLLLGRSCWRWGREVHLRAGGNISGLLRIFLLILHLGARFFWALEFALVVPLVSRKIFFLFLLPFISFYLTISLPGTAVFIPLSMLVV